MYQPRYRIERRPPGLNARWRVLCETDSEANARAVYTGLCAAKRPGFLRLVDTLEDRTMVLEAQPLAAWASMTGRDQYAVTTTMTPRADDGWEQAEAEAHE